MLKTPRHPKHPPKLRQVPFASLQIVGARETPKAVIAREPLKHSPADPDFAERVRSSFSSQQAMRTLAVEIVRLDPGEIELAMPYDPSYTQQHGFMHAGIITTALDSACGYAGFSLMPAGAAVLTVEFKTNLIAPAKGERFAFRARVVKPGKTLTFCDGRAFAIEAGEERLIATMTATLIALVQRQGLAS